MADDILDRLGGKDDFLDKLSGQYRGKVSPRQGDPVISAEMGNNQGHSPVVDVLDFLTGHFPDNSKVKPEVQTVDGKLQVNVPETAEVPFLQSPEMAIGAGASGAIKATGTLAAKAVKGVQEAAGYATGGITDVARGAVKGVQQVADNIVSPESLEAMVKGGKVSTPKPIEAKQPWEMTKEEFDSEFAFNASRTLRGGKLNEGSWFAPKPEQTLAFAQGRIYDPVQVSGVRKKAIKDIEAAADDVFGQEYQKAGLYRRSGEEHTPDFTIEINSAYNAERIHKRLVQNAIKEGKPVPSEVLKEYGIAPESLETLVKGGKTGQLPKYAEGSSINLERMDTTQDIKQFQNAMTKAAEDNIGKKKVSWAQSQKDAEELAWDSKEFLKQAKRKGGFSTAEMQAARQINMNTVTDLFETIKSMPVDPALRTDAMRLGVLDKINNYIEVAKAVSTKSSEAGRALNIHKKMVTDNPEFAQDAMRRKVLQEMMDAMGGSKMTDDMIADLQKVDFKDPRAVREIIQKYHKASLPDMFYEAWMNGILSSPKTQAANLVGNTLTAITKIPETAIASVLRGKSPAGEVRAETVGLLQGIKDGVRVAAKAFETGVPSDMFNKVETRHLHAIPGRAGEIIRIPTRALTAGDEFFKAVVYRAELNRQAYLIAEKEGLKGRALGERMADILNNASGESFAAIHEKAHGEALYRTFNKPLGEFGNSVMRLRDKVPAIRYIIPFIRTPANIAKFALERTPFNFGKIAYDYKAGKITADQLSQELAKPIMGSMMAAATTIGVLDGNITGGPPKNKKERELLYAKGWQPYSIKVGDKYYSYARLEPVGSVIGMTADFVNEAKSDAEINDKAGRVAVSFSRNIASKTFMQGLSSILDAISDPERYGGQWMEKTAGSIVPSVVGNVAQTYDPYIRDVQTPWDAIQARIPYYSTKLPYKVGVTITGGNPSGYGLEIPAERPGTPLQRLISPMTISQEVDPERMSLINAEMELHGIKSTGMKLKSEDKKAILKEYRRTP